MRVYIAAFSVLLFGASPSRLVADPVTLSGTGVVNALGNPEDVCVSCAMDLLGFSFGIGDLLAFSLSFHTPKADLAPNDPTFAAYDLGSGSFTLDGGKYKATGPVVAQVFNLPATPFGIADDLSIVANPQRGDIDALPRIGLGIEGFEFLGNWLTTDGWPVDVAGTLNSAPFKSVWLFDRAAEHGTFARLGNVQFTQTPVPEPSTIALLGIGVAGLCVRQWRHRKAIAPRTSHASGVASGPERGGSLFKEVSNVRLS